MNRFFLTIILTFIAFTSAGAQSLRLPVTFSDHMVLQRNRPLTLSGHAPAGESVRLSFNGNSYLTVSDPTGSFSFQLPPQPAGGPFSLSFTCGQEVKTYTEVYLGEVWLCSGQSNMQFALKDCSTASEDLAEADTLSRVHIYNMCAAFIPFREIWTPQRIEAVDRGAYIQSGTWQKCSAAAAGPFSAIGFHVGRILSQKLGCHVGLIANALDGCTTEGWIDRTTLQDEVPEMLEGNWTDNPQIMSWSRRRAKYNLQQVNICQHRHPYEPAYLFDAAIRPLAAYPVRGVLWYQGESNAELAEMHERLFASLQHSWRKYWNNPEMPFHFVQIASLSDRPTWPQFRDSQRRLADRLPFTTMTVSHDMGEADNIHPTRKRIVAERLAAAVLHDTYGFEDIVCCGPTPQSAVLRDNGTVCITFEHAEGLHFGQGSGAADFSMVNRKGKSLSCSSVRLEGQTVVLPIPEGLNNPVKVRFAYQDNSTAQLLNAAGMPCSTFEWDLQLPHSADKLQNR